MDDLLKKFAYQHEDVSTISPLEIKEVEKDESKKLWLMDVRGPEEMKVSMIKESISKAKFEEALPEPSDPKNVLVPYCTIGGRYGGWLLFSRRVCYLVPRYYSTCLFSENLVAFFLILFCNVNVYRSGAYCNELKRRGYTHVFNGTGILEWAHEIGGDLVTPQGEETVRVHVHSQSFDSLLPPEFISVF